MHRQKVSLSPLDKDQSADGFFVPSEDHPRALNHDRAPDEVRMLRHQPQGCGARWRILLQAALAVKLVTRVEKLAVIAGADQRVELSFGKTPIEINFLEHGSTIAEQCPRLAAGAAVGL
jgi:hypothetical protein